MDKEEALGKLLSVAKRVRSAQLQMMDDCESEDMLVSLRDLGDIEFCMEPTGRKHDVPLERAVLNALGDLLEAVEGPDPRRCPGCSLPTLRWMWVTDSPPRAPEEWFWGCYYGCHLPEGNKPVGEPPEVEEDC